MSKKRRRSFAFLQIKSLAARFPHSTAGPERLLADNFTSNLREAASHCLIKPAARAAATPRTPLRLHEVRKEDSLSCSPPALLTRTAGATKVSWYHHLTTSATRTWPPRPSRALQPVSLSEALDACNFTRTPDHRRISRDLRKASQCTPADKEHLDRTRLARARSEGSSNRFNAREAGCHMQSRVAPSTARPGTLQEIRRGSRSLSEHTA